jgi:hypothetical protein
LQHEISNIKHDIVDLKKEVNDLKINNKELEQEILISKVMIVFKNKVLIMKILNLSIHMKRNPTIFIPVMIRLSV